MLFVHKDGTLRIRNCYQSKYHIYRNWNLWMWIRFSTLKTNKKEVPTFNIFFSPSPLYRAQERSAWRQARMKSLEQDALQAQKMIQSMNELADDILESKNEVISFNTTKQTDKMIRFFYYYYFCANNPLRFSYTQTKITY